MFGWPQLFVRIAVFSDSRSYPVIAMAESKALLKWDCIAVAMYSEETGTIPESRQGQMWRLLLVMEIYIEKIIHSYLLHWIPVSKHRCFQTTKVW